MLKRHHSPPADTSTSTTSSPTSEPPRHHGSRSSSPSCERPHQVPRALRPRESQRPLRMPAIPLQLPRWLCYQARPTQQPRQPDRALALRKPAETGGVAPSSRSHTAASLRVVIRTTDPRNTLGSSWTYSGISVRFPKPRSMPYRYCGPTSSRLSCQSTRRRQFHILVTVPSACGTRSRKVSRHRSTNHTQTLYLHLCQRAIHHQVNTRCRSLLHRQLRRFRFTPKAMPSSTLPLRPTRSTSPRQPPPPPPPPPHWPSSTPPFIKLSPPSPIRNTMEMRGTCRSRWLQLDCTDRYSFRLPHTRIRASKALLTRRRRRTRHPIRTPDRTTRTTS